MWNKLYNAAVKVQNGRTISPFIDAGGVAAAILTKQGNIYVGVCIDTASTLGMCAERNAIANMITNGESQIDKVVAVMPDGRVGSPCGACREYMMQLDKNSGDIEILLDLETQKTIKLKELIPNWWGYDRFGSQSNEYDTEEGCLSLLGGPRKCKRYKTIKVQYQTTDLKTRTKTYIGWTVQIIRHEVDHCNGVLI